MHLLTGKRTTSNKSTR